MEMCTKDQPKEYIERGALIAALEMFAPGRADSVVDRLVRNIPAADVVEVVHGEWCWEGKFKACSECGSYVEWNETLGANFWKYCPYCGAKMGGGKTNAK